MPTKKSQGQIEPQTGDEQTPRAVPEFRPMPSGRSDTPESGIGQRIQFARKQLGLSIEALARYTKYFDTKDGKGIPPTSLLRYESGKYEPGAREIRILCDAFDASPRWLIYGALDNAGQDATEQNLVRALESYVVERVKERGAESGVQLRKAFGEKHSSAQRFEWLEKVKKP